MPVIAHVKPVAGKLCPWAKSDLLAAFVCIAVFEYHVLILSDVSGCVCPLMAHFSYDREQMAQKAKNIYFLSFYSKRLPPAVLSPEQVASAVDITITVISYNFYPVLHY